MSCFLAQASLTAGEASWNMELVIALPPASSVAAERRLTHLDTVEREENEVGWTPPPSTQNSWSAKTRRASTLRPFAPPGVAIANALMSLIALSLAGPRGIVAWWSNILRRTEALCLVTELFCLGNQVLA